MVIDIHAHYVPRDGQEMAAEIGKRHHLKLEKDDRGYDGLTRGGRLLGQLDGGYKVDASCHEKIPKTPGEYVKLFYFDTIAHSQMALEYLVANFGAEHVLLGSDYPYDMGDPEPVETVRRANLDSRAKEQIVSRNACRLLRVGA